LVAVAALVLEVLIQRHRLHLYELFMLAALVPSVILHEVSHGAVAYAFGDDTAKRAGRLTLNPIAHVDPFGSIVLPALLLLTGVGAFGWAKPVPVDVSKLRSPRNQAVMVGLAGPAVNIAIAVVVALVFRHLASSALLSGLSHSSGALPSSPGLQFLYLAGYMNVLLAAFNLIPIPPLDGSALIERLVPDSALPAYYRLRSAMIVVVFLMVFIAPSILRSVFSYSLGLWGRLIG
jgi:Zn-dependent protease